MRESWHFLLALRDVTVANDFKGGHPKSSRLCCCCFRLLTLSRSDWCTDQSGSWSAFAANRGNYEGLRQMNTHVQFTTKRSRSSRPRYQCSLSSLVSCTPYHNLKPLYNPLALLRQARWSSDISTGTAGSCATPWAGVETPPTRPPSWCTASEPHPTNGIACSNSSQPSQLIRRLSEG